MSPSTLVPNVSSRAVPKPIIRKLQALVRRTQRILFFRGIFGMVALGLGTLLGMVAVDYFLTLATPGARVGLMLCGLVVVAIAAIRLALVSRNHRLNLVTAARLVEVQHPEIQERISSTVELHGNGETDVAFDLGTSQVSAAMVAALTEEAELEAVRINPRREISAKPVRSYLLAALLLAFLWVLVFHLWPTHASLALARMFSPNANLDNLPAIDLNVTPGDRFVAIGDELTIRATGPEGTSTDSVIEIIDSTGFASQRSGQPDAGIQDRLSASWQFPAVMSSFRYRVRAGRALTRYYEITAVTRPKAEAFEVRLEFPEYTTRQPKTIAELPQVIEAVVGTQLTLRVTTNVPAAHSQLLATSKEPAEKASGASSPGSLQPVAEPTSFKTDDGQPGCSWTFTLEPEMAGPAAIVLEDEHGVTSTPIPFELKVIPDRPPTVSIVAPTAPTMKAKPADRITLKYQAQDDFGLSQIAMLLKLDENPTPEIPQPFPDDAAKPLLGCQGEAVLDLKQLDLSMVHRVTVQMQATDTLPKSRKGPQRGVSKPLVIEIEHPADKSPEALKAAMEKRQEEERKEAEKLEELAKRQEELAKEAEKQPPEAKEQPAQEPPKPDPAKEAAWKQAEQAVAKETAEMIKKQPEALRAELKADQQQAKEMAHEAKELAKQQQQLRRETIEAAQKPDSEKLKKEILQQLAQQQKALAQETAKLEEPTKATDPAAAKELAAAKEKMDKAAEQMQSSQDPAQAATEAHQAEKDLQKAAEAASQHKDAQPPQSPQQAAEQQHRNEQMREMAKQEKNIAEALDAVKEGDLKKALAKMEKGVQEKAQDLKEQAQEMSKRAEALALDQSTRNEARAAAEKLGEAQQNAAQAEKQLPQTPAPAAESELRAAQALERSAGLLSQLSRDLGRQADALKGKEPEKAEEGRDLASALQEATEAAQTQDAQQRAEAARAAAQALAQASQEASARVAAHDPAWAKAHPDARLPGGSKESNPPNKPTAVVKPAPGSKVKPVQTKTADTDWVKFRGQVKSEAQNEADQDMSDEYRELVRRYFEELAKQGGAKKGK